MGREVRAGRAWTGEASQTNLSDRTVPGGWLRRVQGLPVIGRAYSADHRYRQFGLAIMAVAPVGRRTRTCPPAARGKCGASRAPWISFTADLVARGRPQSGWWRADEDWRCGSPLKDAICARTYGPIRS
jgi:hypothetical protein